MRRAGQSAVALCAFVAIGSNAPIARAQPLPQMISIQTLDKAFNDAAKDLNILRSFELRDCGNAGRHFICTYVSSSGLGILAWAKQSAGLIEQLAIAVPPCNSLAELEHISGILFHTFHPRRPVSTFSRAIESMVNYSATVGPGEHWQDGVSYRLVNRGGLGFGLIVNRAPPAGSGDGTHARRQAALRQQFLLPDFACDGLVEPVPLKAAPRRGVYED